MTSVYLEHFDFVARLVARGFSFLSGGVAVRFSGFSEPDEQQGVIQETFVRAFSDRARAAFSGLQPFEAYLQTIARNVVIDRLRARQREARYLMRDASKGDRPAADERALTPEQQLQRDAIVELVRLFVAELPDRDRRFVALRYEEGLTQEQVARRLRVGRSTVRTLEQRVRRRLLKALRSRGIVDGGGTAGGVGVLALALAVIAAQGGR